MSMNYKKLGDYITQRREKNTTINLPICGLCREGLIPPKQQDADISLYNVFYKNDFIFNPARMELNSITLNTEYDKAICSSLYEIFYINDTSKLLPEFLFVQLKTDNFVRFCEFQGQGSVREYCRFANISEYPVIVPDLKEQEKIVNTYNAITKRIQLKQKINENLEKTAQTIYRKMFVEDADEKWETVKLEKVIEVRYGKDHKNLEKGNIPVYGSGGIMRYANKYLYDKESVMIPRKGSLNNIIYTDEPFWSVDTMFYTSMKKQNFAKYFYEFIRTKDFLNLDTGSAVPSMTTDYLNNIEILNPDNTTLEKFESKVSRLYISKQNNYKEISKLQELKQLVISRISGM